MEVEEEQRHAQILYNEETAVRSEREEETVQPTIKGEAVVNSQRAVESRQATGAIKGAIWGHALLKESGKAIQWTIWRDLNYDFVTMTKKVTKMNMHLKKNNNFQLHF